MRRGILYIVLIGACVYIGIINKEKSYFFAAVIMTAVMLSLIAGLIVRYIRTSVKMQMNIPVVEKNSTFCPNLRYLSPVVRYPMWQRCSVFLLRV